jgi:hypothetical protein
MSSLESKNTEKARFELEKLMGLPGEGSSSGKATGVETDAEVEPPDGYQPSVQG